VTFSSCIMLSLKLLDCPLIVSQSRAIVRRHRIRFAFFGSITLFSVPSRSVWSRQAAARLNSAHSTDRPTSFGSVFRRHDTVRWFSATSALSDDVMNVFDRNTKREQRNKTANLPDYKVYDYLKDEV